MQQLRGKVVLVDFWTYTCINCIDVLPHVKAWNQQFSNQGLVVVGVHTPEYPFERNTDNVKEAIKRLGITYPSRRTTTMRRGTPTTTSIGRRSIWSTRRDASSTRISVKVTYDQTEAKIKSLLAENP